MSYDALKSVLNPVHQAESCATHWAAGALSISCGVKCGIHLKVLAGQVFRQPNCKCVFQGF